MKAEEIRKKAEEKEGKTRTYEVSEWGLSIQYIPITVADTQYLSQKLKDFADEDTWALELIMLKALDEDGERIWTTEEDREFLRTKVHSAILTRLVIAMGGRGGIESAKKNLKKPRS